MIHTGLPRRSGQVRHRGIDADHQIHVCDQRRRIGEILKHGVMAYRRCMCCQQRAFLRRDVFLQGVEVHAGHRQQRRQHGKRHGGSPRDLLRSPPGDADAGRATGQRRRAAHRSMPRRRHAQIGHLRRDASSVVPNASGRLSNGVRASCCGRQIGFRRHHLRDALDRLEQRLEVGIHLDQHRARHAPPAAAGNARTGSCRRGLAHGTPARAARRSAQDPALQPPRVADHDPVPGTGIHICASPRHSRRASAASGFHSNGPPARPRSRPARRGRRRELRYNGIGAPEPRTGRCRDRSAGLPRYRARQQHARRRNTRLPPPAGRAPAMPAPRLNSGCGALGRNASAWRKHAIGFFIAAMRRTGHCRDCSAHQHRPAATSMRTTKRRPPPRR